MKATHVPPTGVERKLGEDELIVTKTDPRGLLTYTNDVFLRISALREDEAIGQPHNIIRHPEMPRAVFKLLWETIGDRREVFAYVQNLALDGAHYWVLAHVTPSVDEHGRLVGYHSSRRRPDDAAVAEISRIYADLRAEELRHAASPAGLDASWAMLQRLLDDRGQTYDAFVWSLTNGALR
ncbi:PAS domain-containing protein [Amorphoplanes digitatis]|uniref:PAS domain S-box-containing protein n=1 Tax=Actinoplanes digitatis TaxID=1868 RepID=A0A7W7HSZ7_9ACTN|nr:PAS domain-containing protein [Actinoplanes digitatis]MBB4760231.1 PAS domain S-box-containing protein [Actinoplanes digitatis]GID94757.1 chemotaxis protein [Actinoplanes digitatis]